MNICSKVFVRPIGKLYSLNPHEKFIKVMSDVCKQREFLLVGINTI